MQPLSLPDGKKYAETKLQCCGANAHSNTFECASRWADWAVLRLFTFSVLFSLHDLAKCHSVL